MPGVDVTSDSQRQLVMQSRLRLLWRAFENEVVVLPADDHVRNDLPKLRRDFRQFAGDEEMSAGDEVKNNARAIANERPCDVRSKQRRFDNHDLLAHRRAASTASCRSPFVDTALPPFARGWPSMVLNRPPASSTMT